MFNFKNKKIITFQFLLILVLLLSCSNNKNIVIDEISDAEIYQSGLYYLQENNYEKAAVEFDKLYLNYPFSPLASKAEIMTAYALFENNQIKKAISKLEEFIDINPSGELSEYAQYLLAMSYYVQVSTEGRDPSLSLKALKYFQIITTKYPNSIYAKDAKLKIEYINKNRISINHLKCNVIYINNFDNALDPKIQNQLKY